MFENKNPDGTSKLCGPRIRERRKAKGLSQRALADPMQRKGLGMNKNAVQKIESGERS